MLRAAGIIGDEWGTGRTESDLETSKQLRERRRRGDHNAEERGQGFQSGTTMRAERVTTREDSQFVRQAVENDGVNDTTYGRTRVHA